MKSKHLFLIALCLLALFTACQQEELKEVSPQVGTPLPELNVEMPQLKAPTIVRMSEEEMQAWESQVGEARDVHAHVREAKKAHSSNARQSGEGSYENPNNNPCDIDEESLRILFIGNSHTANYGIDLPRLFEDFAVHNGQDISSVQTAAVNGFTLAQHLNYGPTLSKVNQGDWDYVILQENSWILTTNHPQFANSVNSFVNLIDNNSPDAKVLLYQIAPPYDHNGSTYNNLYNDWNILFPTVANNYSHVYVVNAARAYEAAYNGMFGYVANNPDWLRYDSQFDFHPASTGGFLVAATFYAAIFRGKPCIPTNMYFYLGYGNFGYDPVVNNVDEFHIMVQIGFLAELTIHDRRGKCISYPVGVYPCP